jgi:hypothetical protein
VADGENSFWTFCVEHLEGGPPRPPACRGVAPRWTTGKC